MNLSNQSITLNKGTVVATVTAANIIPPMLAPKPYLMTKSRRRFLRKLLPGSKSCLEHWIYLVWMTGLKNKKKT